MELESTSHEKRGFFAGGWRARLKSLADDMVAKVVDIARNIKRVSKDDPRRVTHSIKVGIAVTLISLLYYCQPLYDNFGVNALWAVMTVVVVFEFSVGATIGKGLNRGLATMVAGGLGIGAHHLASLSGKIGEPILLGFFVFLQAVSSTFLRFFPKIKAKYDYGMLIFILTFSLISVSGFRADEILELAYKRLSTIIIGGSACVIISLLIFPVWAGHDLHKLICNNLKKLGNCLEGFGEEYFKTRDTEFKEEKLFMEEYESVLNSKNIEESLANFAWWEPGHGSFKFRHPWTQYLKVGTMTRQCAYRIEALNSYLNTNVQTTEEIHSKFQDAYRTTCIECGKAMKELSLTVKTMTQPSAATPHIENAKSVAKNLKPLLKSGLWKDIDFFTVIHFATLASLLIDIVDSIKKVSEAVDELASLAQFELENRVVPTEKSELTQSVAVNRPLATVRTPHIAIAIGYSSKM